MRAEFKDAFVNQTQEHEENLANLYSKKLSIVDYLRLEISSVSSAARAQLQITEKKLRRWRSRKDYAVLFMFMTILIIYHVTFTTQMIFIQLSGLVDATGSVSGTGTPL